MKELKKKEASEQAKTVAQHKSFHQSRVGVYVGGNEYMQLLDEHVDKPLPERSKYYFIVCGMCKMSQHAFRD